MSGWLESLVGAGGGVWVAANVIEFVAVMAESAGAAPGADGEKPKRSALATLFMAVCALLTPGLLYAHAYVAWSQSTAAHDALLTFITAIGSLTVIFSVFGGGIIGWLIGLVAKPARSYFHHAALGLAITALVLAFAAALPSLPLLIDAVAQRFG